MITSLNNPAKCIRCGGRLSAPEKRVSADEEVVSYRWSCAKCGCAFDTSAWSRQDAPMTAEIVQEFLPNLLVA